MTVDDYEYQKVRI